jgi:competence protein ComEC
MKWLNLILIWLVIFLLRFSTSLQANKNLDSYTGKPITIKGRISSQITLQGNNQSFNVGRVKVKTSLYPVYHYGDHLVISGTLQKQVINKWISRFSLLYPRIEKIESGNNIFIGLKEELEDWYSRVLPEPEAGLMAGIVLGSKRSLPQEFWKNLQKTGTLHLVVASGFNVTVIMGAVIFLLAGILPRPAAVFLGIAAVMAYSLVAGLEPAIVRAAIMGSLAYFGQILGRAGTGLRLLFFAVGIMLWLKPEYLGDIGFQLSFLATLGLILILPRLPAWLPPGARETISAQLMVWPVLLINFGQMSWIGILVNSLIVLFVPYVMALFVLPWLAYAPLHLMVLIINGLAQVF